jgi:hypothetical protein
MTRLTARENPGAASWCMHPPFVAYHQWLAVKLILLVVSQNLGKGRIVNRSVMKRGLKVHRSVKARILARGVDGKNEGYLPKIRCAIKDGEEPRCLEKKEWLADKPEYFEWVD